MSRGTPNQLATYGHIAALLREYMKRHDLGPGDMQQKIGIPRGSTTIYPWINGSGAPGKKLRAKLAKVLEVSEDQLLRREPPQGAVAIKERPAPVAAAPRASDVLSFTAASDGTARIRLDITLPIDQAMPIFRMLMDANLLVAEAQS